MKAREGEFSLGVAVGIVLGWLLAIPLFWLLHVAYGLLQWWFAVMAA
jgi:hypothetical protein